MHYISKHIDSDGKKQTTNEVWHNLARNEAQASEGTLYGRVMKPPTPSA